jgi:hypothetical protein
VKMANSNNAPRRCSEATSRSGRPVRPPRARTRERQRRAGQG